MCLRKHNSCAAMTAFIQIDKHLEFQKWCTVYTQEFCVMTTDDDGDLCNDDDYVNYKDLIKRSGTQRWLPCVGCYHHRHYTTSLSVVAGCRIIATLPHSYFMSKSIVRSHSRSQCCRLCDFVFRFSFIIFIFSMIFLFSPFDVCVAYYTLHKCHCIDVDKRMAATTACCCNVRMKTEQNYSQIRSNVQIEVNWMNECVLDKSNHIETSPNKLTRSCSRSLAIAHTHRIICVVVSQIVLST